MEITEQRCAVVRHPRTVRCVGDAAQLTNLFCPMDLETRFDELPPPCRALWAKSGETGGHGLLAHLLDVSAVALAILEREPPSTLRMVARGFGLPVEATGPWIAAIAGLHDYGKAVPGFQRKWKEGADRIAESGLVPDATPLSDHALATAGLLPGVLRARVNASFDWCEHVVQAISAHHGYHYLPTQVEDVAECPGGECWRQARQSVFDALWAVLLPRGVPSTDCVRFPFVNWLAGITSVADWIASNREWFPHGERETQLGAYWNDAVRLAQSALAQIGWAKWQAPGESSPGGMEDLSNVLSRMVNRAVASPRPLQALASKVLAEVQEPTLLVVEAPMGEGKTEVAFLAHLRLGALHQHRGLYVALPTQATSNALYERARLYL